jgi:hypothetical protein
MKKVIFAFLALVFCGQLRAQEVEGVTSEYISAEGKYTYNIPLWEVPDWQDPVASGEWFDWGTVSIKGAQNGFYNFPVTSFNGPINFYWNDKVAKANPYLNESTPGYNPKNGLMRYFLKDGKAYVTEQEQKQPGEHGDHLIRYTINKDGTVTLFCNVADIGAGAKDAYVIHSAASPTNWWEKKIPLKFSDASGWGFATVVLKDNTYFEQGSNTSYLLAAFGAYKNDKESYPSNFVTSKQLNSDKNGFKIPLKQ